MDGGHECLCLLNAQLVKSEEIQASRRRPDVTLEKWYMRDGDVTGTLFVLLRCCWVFLYIIPSLSTLIQKRFYMDVCTLLYLFFTVSGL